MFVSTFSNDFFQWKKEKGKEIKCKRKMFFFLCSRSRQAVLCLLSQMSNSIDNNCILFIPYILACDLFIRFIGLVWLLWLMACYDYKTPCMNTIFDTHKKRRIQNSVFFFCPSPNASTASKKPCEPQLALFNSMFVKFKKRNWHQKPKSEKTKKQSWNKRTFLCSCQFFFVVHYSNSNLNFERKKILFMFSVWQYRGY